MTKPAFYVSLHELEDGPKELSGTITDEWLSRVLSDTDAVPVGTNDGQIDVIFTKTGLDVLVQGRLSANVSVPCSRTLDAAVYRVHPEIFLLLVPSAKRLSTLAGERSHHKKSGKVRSDSRKDSSRETPAKTSKAQAKSTSGWENDPVLSDQDAAQDTYDGDQIVLDSFLREFILLELPMIPLREDLRGTSFEANPPLPDIEGTRSTAQAHPSGSTEKPLDPRFSALVELKARLEKKE